MDINQLIQFQAAAKYENLTKAAEELYMTQSALSKSIQHLENELHTKLFDRHGKTITLNQAGEIVQKFSSHMIEMTDFMKSAIAEVTSSEKITINMATTRPIIARFLFPKISVQHSEIPLNTNLLNVSKNEAASLLTSGIYDLLISSYPIEDDGIKSILQSEEKMFLCVAKDSPLASKDFIKKEDFAGLVFPATKYSYDTMFRPILDELKEKNLSFNTIMINDIGAVNYLKKISDIPSIITDVAWSFEQTPNRTIIEIEGIPTRKNYINFLEKNEQNIEHIVKLLMTEYKDFSDK